MAVTGRASRPSWLKKPESEEFQVIADFREKPEEIYRKTLEFLRYATALDASGEFHAFYLYGGFKIELQGNLNSDFGKYKELEEDVYKKTRETKPGSGTRIMLEFAVQDSSEGGEEAIMLDVCDLSRLADDVLKSMNQGRIVLADRTPGASLVVRSMKSGQKDSLVLDV